MRFRRRLTSRSDVKARSAGPEPQQDARAEGLDGISTARSHRLTPDHVQRVPVQADFARAKSSAAGAGRSQNRMPARAGMRFRCRLASRSDVKARSAGPEPQQHARAKGADGVPTARAHRLTAAASRRVRFSRARTASRAARHPAARCSGRAARGRSLLPAATDRRNGNARPARSCACCRPAARSPSARRG